jgi:FHA domain
MMKCPVCQHENEEGALFCEQCKSDLSAAPATMYATAETAPSAVPAAPAAVPVAEPVPASEPPPGAVPVAMSAAEPALAADFSATETMQPVGRPVPPAMPAPPAEPAPAEQLPAGAQPKLVVLRGLKINTEYPLYEGHNFIGRADEKPVDIDLDDQESPDRVWASRQHALITFEDGQLFIEDLNSSNGTYVNRSRVYPGQRRPLRVGDLIQIGTVHLKVKV